MDNSADVSKPSLPLQGSRSSISILQRSTAGERSYHNTLRTACTESHSHCLCNLYSCSAAPWWEQREYPEGPAPACLDSWPCNLLWSMRMWCELFFLLLCLITIQLFEFILIKLELSFHSNRNDQNILTWYTNTVCIGNLKCNEAK